MDNPSKIRKLALGSVVGILIIILLVWLRGYLGSGKIIVTTNNPYSLITLTNLASENNNPKPQTFKAHSKLSVTVKTGEYLASVEGNSAATTQIIHLSSHKTLNYSLNPASPSGVEPVAYENAQDLVADSSQLLYLDTSSGYLYKIDSHNDLSRLDSSQQFQAVKWADTSFGVGQGSNGQLYAITNGSVSPLKVPFSYGNSAIGFDVSTNKQVYVSYGSAVYAESSDGSFKKVYTATSSVPTIAAGANAVAVGVAPSDVDETAVPSLTTISTSGVVVKKSIEVTGLAWSPDGRYLLEEERGGIYDSSLNRIGSLPTNSFIGSAKWLNDSTLFYSTDSQLWTYSLTNQRAELLANMPVSGKALETAISDDNSYVYIVAQVSSNTTAVAIKRVSLHAQAVPAFVYQLQDIMPISNDSYSLSMINFAQPTAIVVQSNINTPSSDYEQTAQSQLQSLGFDLSKLSFQLGPGQIGQ